MPLIRAVQCTPLALVAFVLVSGRVARLGVWVGVAGWVPELGVVVFHTKR